MKVKNGYFILLTIISCSFFFSGCEDDEDESNNGIVCEFVGTSNFSMTVYGNNWVAECGSWGPSTSYGMTSLGIIGSRVSDKSSIAIWLLGFSGVGIYDDLDSNTGFQIIFSDTFYIPISCTMDITKYTNTELSGTFNFTADNGVGDTISITNGVFTDLLR